MLPCRVNGTVRHLLARMEFSLEDGDLVADDRGMILVFGSAAEARGLGARLFPEPEAETESARELATLRRGLEEMYGPVVVGVDLDRAADWARNPQSRAATPSVLLEAWRLLAWSGVAPEPARWDPMGFAGLYMGRAAGASLPEREALIATAMKLDGLVRQWERQRDRRPPGTATEDGWPEHGELWTAADAQRLAAVLVAAIPAFAARLTDDVATAERRIRRHRTPGGSAAP